jgi:ankyrin repeat protein
LALLLLIFKADKTLRDDDGKTPREVAESKGQTAIVALFDQPVPSK